MGGINWSWHGAGVRYAFLPWFPHYTVQPLERIAIFAGPLSAESEEGLWIPCHTWLGGTGQVADKKLIMAAGLTLWLIPEALPEEDRGS